MNEVLLRDAYRMHQAGRFAEASRLYSEVLKADPKLADVQVAFGAALSSLGRHAEALTAYEKAVAMKPSNALAWCHRGSALLELGRPADALASYDRTLGIKAGYIEAWRLRGLALARLQRFEDALQSFEKALALDARDGNTLEDRGNLLMQLRRHAEAVLSYDRALKVRPASASLHYNRGNALSILGRYEEAIDACERVLALDRDYPYARGVTVHSRLQCCDWRALHEEKTKIAAAISAGKKVVSPFNHKALSDSPAEQLRCARVWVMNELSGGVGPAPALTRRHDRIRLAYVSADLNNSAVATLMVGIFEHHDRSQFETVAMSFGPETKTPMRARLEAGFEHFIDVRQKSDADIATCMRDMEIDIAVDLMGYTGACRSGILAQRPAPVQVNFLGFPGTMGAPWIDYIIADETVIPKTAHRHYDEKVAYLPHTYIPNDDARRIADRKPTREDAGLPKEGFVFASFNNAYKFTPAMFGVWMRLLRAVPGSVLWLPKHHDSVVRNLEREAEARGVAPARLIFAPQVPAPEDHLARLSLADLFLDTLPYNAHTTAVDALWSGLPVVTCLGNAFAGRVAASVLYAAGLAELVTDSLADYEALAIKLAKDTAKLAAVRNKLAKNRHRCALFDTARFTKHLEAAYSEMWRRASNGEAPASFAITPD